MDCGEAHVTTAGAVLAFALEMFEERPQQRRVEFGHREIRGCLAQALLCILKEQAKGITVARDGMRARLTLLHEPIHEERLHKRGERADGIHSCCPCLVRSTCRSA